MDIKILDENLDWETINYKLSSSGHPEVSKFLKNELLNQIIADTTLAHNRWEKVAGKSNTYRGSGGFSILVYSNRLTLQNTGEGHLNLDEFDIKDITKRFLDSIEKNRRFDLENLFDKEPSVSIGRLDSQITMAIKPEEIVKLFNPDDFSLNGRGKSFSEHIGGVKVFTGLNWIKKKRQVDYYKIDPEELKKFESNKIDQRDFIRIYDKIYETMDTTNPHDPKRIQIIDKYKDYMKQGYRIFRVEIQENDRRLTKHLADYLNEDKATFLEISKKRFESFAKRNPFKLWEALAGLGVLKTQMPK